MPLGTGGDLFRAGSGSSLHVSQSSHRSASATEACLAKSRSKRRVPNSPLPQDTAGINGNGAASATARNFECRLFLGAWAMLRHCVRPWPACRRHCTGNKCRALFLREATAGAVQARWLGPSRVTQNHPRVGGSVCHRLTDCLNSQPEY